MVLHVPAGAAEPFSVTLTLDTVGPDQFGMTSSTAVCGSVDPVMVAVAVETVPARVNDGVTVTGSRLRYQSRTPTAFVFHRLGLPARYET